MSLIVDCTGRVAEPAELMEHGFTVKPEDVRFVDGCVHSQCGKRLSELYDRPLEDLCAHGLHVPPKDVDEIASLLQRAIENVNVNMRRIYH